MHSLTLTQSVYLLVFIFYIFFCKYKSRSCFIIHFVRKPVLLFVVTSVRRSETLSILAYNSKIQVCFAQILCFQFKYFLSQCVYYIKKNKVIDKKDYEKKICICRYKHRNTRETAIKREKQRIEG